MNSVDRGERTQKLRERLAGITLDGALIPSSFHVDRFCTMLQKSCVTYVKWELCTSRQQELVSEPEVKGLRITETGLVFQDIGKDKPSEAKRRQGTSED